MTNEVSNHTVYVEDDWFFVDPKPLPCAMVPLQQVVTTTKESPPPLLSKEVELISLKISPVEELPSQAPALHRETSTAALNVENDDSAPSNNGIVHRIFACCFPCLFAENSEPKKLS